MNLPATKVIGEVDILIAGAGPVGLMCAYLAHRCGLKAVVVDKSLGPLQVGRADALNARSLQLLELADLFDDLYPLGKPCNTSSVWSNGQFISRQSAWWDELQGCFHKHFLMLGQSYIEKLLDERLTRSGVAVERAIEIKDIRLVHGKCQTTLSSGEVISSDYVIGADGSHSFVREHFQVPFEIVRPELVWAVIDGVLETDFPKVPEIIVFQNETSDVAWIPREGNLDRFYVRMDTKNFTIEDAIAKIKRALEPHQLSFKEIIWFSRFSVKESVAEKFNLGDRVFLAGDSCHIHSVNGGQGLNTGLGDAFNLMWKLNLVIRHSAPTALLQSYENERKPVAKSVVETSAELVRATKFSKTGTHAQDYIDIVRRRSGHITGMGIRYGSSGQIGQRLQDFEVHRGDTTTRIYSLLDYTKFTLLVFSQIDADLQVPEFMQIIPIYANKHPSGYWMASSEYQNQVVLIRPDSYIDAVVPIDLAQSLIESIRQFRFSSVEPCS
jgi:2-polyprenyl-6-methoxyphenol hydroxylase-like FAD-dependent oxidoreductase